MWGMSTCWISALVAFEFLLFTLPTSCRICAKTTCPKFTTIAAAKPLWASPPDQKIVPVTHDLLCMSIEKKKEQE